MRRYELSDEAWGLIEGLLPRQRRRRRGRRWRDHRQVLNGVFWVLRSGSAWRDVPERYGPWRTCYGRFVRWRRDGTFGKILSRLHALLEAGGPDRLVAVLRRWHQRAGGEAGGGRGQKRGRRAGSA